MKILIDECIDRRIARDIAGHEVRTVQQMGWAGTKNGALLLLASAQFDVFITADRNLAFQQNRDTLPLPVIVMHARSNRLGDLKPLLPELLQVLDSARRESVTVVGRG